MRIPRMRIHAHNQRTARPVPRSSISDTGRAPRPQPPNRWSPFRGVYRLYTLLCIYYPSCVRQICLDRVVCRPTNRRCKCHLMDIQWILCLDGGQKQSLLRKWQHCRKCTCHDRDRNLYRSRHCSNHQRKKLRLSSCL